MALGYYQAMYRRLRIKIAESEYRFVFVQLIAVELAGNDSTEQTI
jgi:hypothetical protein